MAVQFPLKWIRAIVIMQNLQKEFICNTVPTVHTWYNIQYFYTYSSMTATATLPAAAMTSSTQLRLYQQSYSGSSYDAWIVDDFEVDAGLGMNLAFSPDTGNTAVGDSELVNIIIYTDSLQQGLHTFQGYINSNDPVDSTVYLTVNLTLDGVE